MPKVQVFDPAMCCPTGVCGAEVDPALIRFAADLEWLKSNGVEVERFNLSQQPAAFVANAEVAAAMRARDDALPLIVVDGKVVSQAGYPSRGAIAKLVGLSLGDACCSAATAEPLATIGSARTSKKCC